MPSQLSLIKKKERRLGIDRARQLLVYNDIDGRVVWRVSRGCRNAGEVAGCPRLNKGYITICVDKTHFYAHRLAWFLHYGKWPCRYVDHIDGDKTNNIITNLREATTSQNKANSPAIRVATKSKLKGVSWYASEGKWGARIGVNYNRIFLGLFSERKNAHAAYLRAAKKYFGEFTRMAVGS